MHYFWSKKILVPIQPIQNPLPIFLWKKNVSATVQVTLKKPLNISFQDLMRLEVSPELKISIIGRIFNLVTQGVRFVFFFTRKVVGVWILNIWFQYFISRFNEAWSFSWTKNYDDRTIFEISRTTWTWKIMPYFDNREKWFFFILFFCPTSSVVKSLQYVQNTQSFILLFIFCKIVDKNF